MSMRTTLTLKVDILIIICTVTAIVIAMFIVFHVVIVVVQNVSSLMLHWFTLVANLRELSVSAKHSSLGLMLTNIKVFELPPRLFCSRWVSFEFRYGTWDA